jgi:hypothetical protein
MCFVEKGPVYSHTNIIQFKFSDWIAKLTKWIKNRNGHTFSTQIFVIDRERRRVTVPMSYEGNGGQTLKLRCLISKVLWKQ